MHVPTGDDLRTARKARGLTQSEVAEETDLSQPLLSRIENNNVDPRIATLHRLAQVINNTETSLGEKELEVAIPSAIKQERQTVGLTQADLAERSGVSQPLIARIETDKVNPRASTLRAILEALDTGPSDSELEENTSISASGLESGILKEIKDSFSQL